MSASKAINGSGNRQADTVARAVFISFLTYSFVDLHVVYNSQSRLTALDRGKFGICSMFTYVIFHQTCLLSYLNLYSNLESQLIFVIASNVLLVDTQLDIRNEMTTICISISSRLLDPTKADETHPFATIYAVL